jgi:hypothetical protein
MTDFRLPALAVLILAIGCRPADQHSAASREVAVGDSAGVRIVHNHARSPVQLRVGPDPVFVIGWNEGDPPFTWPQSGRILPDGGALIGEFGDGTVYRVAPDGSVVGTWGGKGEGPGEYQAIDAILLKGDSVVVTDSRAGRITIVAPDREVRTQRLPGGFMHEGSALWSDDRLLLVPGESYAGIPEGRPEWVFETQPVLALDLSTSTVDTLADLPHLRRWYGTRGGNPGPIQVKGRAGGFADGFAWARSDRREVRWYDVYGRLEQIARWEEEPSLLSAESRGAVRQRYRKAYESIGRDEAFIEAQLAEVERGIDRHEGPLPYWSRLYVDRRGDVWLARYGLAEDAPGQWRVLDRNGVYHGWVELPGIITILDSTEDRVLAVAQDDLDVPAVLMLSLTKG